MCLIRFALLFYLLTNVITAKYVDCTHIDSINNKIFGHCLDGELIIDSDSEYLATSQQYASTSFPENISPSIILIAGSDKDIKIMLDFAKRCNYKVMSRSGGCQFYGLSSCTGYCIQIDLNNYNDIEIIDIDNNIVRAGVGNKLTSLYSTLNDNNLFVPAGTSASVGLGGHFQTGGIGYLLRSFGAFTDHVIAFDIILANGYKKHVTKNNKYSDLYWAVNGGGPGSFGVVTDLYLQTYSNSNYPNNAMGIQAIWKYTDEDARGLTKQWLLFQNDLQLTEYDDFWPLIGVSYLQTISQHVILVAFIWIEDINDRSYNNTGFVYFMQGFLNSAINAPIIFSETYGTISSLMLSFLSPDIESPYPYQLRANYVSQSWDDAFMDTLIDNITQIITNSQDNGNVFVKMLFESFGGMFLKNDPMKQYSSLQLRDLSMGLTLQVLYSDENGKEYSINYLNDVFNSYINNNWNDEDIRTWSYTFGELDMDQEKIDLNYYRDINVFNKITKIKSKFDECDIFHNIFTVPLNYDCSNKKQCDTKYKRYKRGGRGNHRYNNMYSGDADASGPMLSDVSNYGVTQNSHSLNRSLFIITIGIQILIIALLCFSIILFCYNWCRKVDSIQHKSLQIDMPELS